MSNLIEASEGTRLQGFIEIEKINTKDNIKTHYKNTITSGGKQLLLAKSAGLLMGMSADVYGNVASSNMISTIGTFSGNEVKHCMCGRKDRDITNVLLNLDDNILTGMGTNTSFVNIWNETFTSADKVIGYANNELNPTSNGKEGRIDHCLGEYMVDPYTIAKRWKYDEHTANGKFNCIAMMPGSVLQGPNGDGIKFSKCIDKVNTQYANYVGMSTSFLIPGIPGYTSNQEILLNFEKDGISRWKYNIGTGEMTSVPETENFFVPTLSDNLLADMQYIDNYLYVITGEINRSAGAFIVYVYNPANDMELVTQFNAQGGSRETIIKLCILKINGELYLSGVSNNDTDISPEVTKLYKLEMHSDGYATGVSSFERDFSSLFVLPDGFSNNHVGLGMYGDNYVLYNYVKVYDNLGSNKAFMRGENYGYKCVGYVFTDITDPFNSIIDMIPGICPNEILFANASVKGTLRIGFDARNYAIDNIVTYDLVQDGVIVMNNLNKEPTSTLTADTRRKSVYLTLDKWWTNIFSFVKLNTPIEKTDSDIIYVSYGYKIV